MEESDKPSGKGRDTHFTELSKIFDKVSTDTTAEEQNEQLEMMCSKIEENMSTYIVMGYTLNGDPVTMSYSKTNKDKDALAYLFNRHIVNQINGGSY